MMNQIAKRLMVAGLLTAVGLWAQAQAEFVAASIKPAAPMENGRMMIGMRGGPETPSPAQMTFTNVSLADILQRAYDVKSYQVSGPDWMSLARFDMAAKVPAGATKAQSNVMLQNLLADRFKLVLHHSTKEATIYVLLVAKGGPKLKESAKESTDDAVAASQAAGDRRSGTRDDGQPGTRDDGQRRKAAVAARHSERHSDDHRRGSDDGPGRKDKNDLERSDHRGVCE